MELGEHVARAFSCEREGRLDDALLAWLEVARLLPGTPQPYERLFELHVHRREVDAAFCAASVLASLGALDGMARELYEDYVPRRLPPRVPGRSLDAEDWALLRHPLEDPAIGDRLATFLPKLKLQPASAGAIDMATLAWAAEALGASSHDLPSDGAPPLTDRGDLDEVWGNHTLRERLFLAGREATGLRVPVHRLLQATTIQEASDAVGVSTTDIARWAAGMVLTRARAGMLVCGEPFVAHQLMVGKQADGGMLEQLALFAVSPQHHRLRVKLGVAVGMAADAPAPAPPCAVPFSLAAPARTIREMQFIAERQPCPFCATCNPEPLSFTQEKERWRGRGTCPRCGAPRVFEFVANGDPTTTRQGRFDLGPLRSAVLSPADLLRAYDEECVRMAAIPAIADERARSEAMTRALTISITIVTELLKLLPLGADAMPGATDPRQTRTWLGDEHKRLRLLLRRNAPPCTVDREALDAHRAWLDRGTTGEGQLVLRNKRMCDERYEKTFNAATGLGENVDWTFVEIADSDLTNVYLAEATLEAAVLERVVFTGADLGRAVLVRARIQGGLWTHAAMRGINLSWANLRETDFTASEMEGAMFMDVRAQRAKFDGVRFGSAVFDRAIFRACSFRDASFAELTTGPPTSVDASFIDCDLTGTCWTNRDLSQTSFSNCNFTGAYGRPKATDGLILTDCEIDAAALVAQLTGDTPAPAAPTAPTAPATPRALAEALVESPPCTVDELCAKLGISLAAMLKLSPGRLSLPNLSLRYAFDAGSSHTIEMVRAARPVDWSVTFPTGIAEVENVLATRFGAPIELMGDRRYGPWAIRSGDARGAGMLLNRWSALIPSQTLTSVRVRGEGDLVAVGDDAGRLRIWCPQEARITASHFLGWPLVFAAWTHDGQRLLTITRGLDMLRVFSGDGTKHVSSFSTRHADPTSLAVHPSQDLTATTGADGYARVWDLGTGEPILELKAGAEGTAIALSETHVAVAFRSGHYAMWEFPSGNLVAGGKLFDRPVAFMAFSPDGTSLMCRGGGELLAVSTATCRVDASWRSTPYAPLSARACFVPNTKLILASHLGRLRVWQEDVVVARNIGEITFDDGPKVEGAGTADPVSWWEEARASREKELADAERAALASGKQPFDYAYLRMACPIGDEPTARHLYFILHPEIRTLDEFASYLTESAVWDQR